MYVRTIRVVMLVVMVFFTLALALFIVSLLAGSALGEEEENTCAESVGAAIQELQPWYRPTLGALPGSKRAKTRDMLAEAICTATEKHAIDPLLSVAIAFRESSLLPNQEGSKRERGYFQVMPTSAIEKRFAPGPCSQHEAMCNTQTALGFMAWLRDEYCQSDDAYVWLGAYGRGRCPTSKEARSWPELKAARRILCEIDADCSKKLP